MKHQEKYDVQIELIVDKHKNNAYSYNEKDMVSLKFITDDWFTKLTELRKLYPQNRLLKHLLSSAWGHLNASNIKNINDVETLKDKTLLYE